MSIAAAQTTDDDLPAALPALRDYQAEAVDAVIRRLKGGARATYIELPTGGGKTRILADLAANAQRGRVLALAHTDLLVDQLAGGVRAHGIVKAERDDTGAQIIAASVQTLARPGRLDRILTDPAGPVSLLLVDEAHHAAADTWRAVIQSGLDHGARVVGCTATPYRADGSDIDDVFGPPAFARSILDLQHAGYLVPMVWRLARLELLNLAQIRSRGGDYAAGQLGEAIADEGVLADIARIVVDTVGARRTVVYVPTIACADALAAELIGRGMVARDLSGQTSHDERDRVLAAWKAGEVQTIVNAMLLTEGYDLPSLEAVVIARPTRSQGLYTQMVGRGLRPSPGKQDCLVVDISGNPNLADPNQVLLPAIAGAYTAADLAEIAADDDQPADDDDPDGTDDHERRPRDPEILAGADDAIWVWRAVPGIVGPDGRPRAFYAPLSDAQIAVIRVHPPSGLAAGAAVDVREPALLWQATEACSPRRAVRIVSGQLSDRERKALSRKAAAWRSDTVSVKQLALCERLGVPARPDWSKGQAANAINDVFAGRAYTRIWGEK